MKLVDRLAPPHSRRRLALKIGRTALSSPGSALNRLSAVNFLNWKAVRRLRIHCPVCGDMAGVSYDFPDVRLRREHGIGLLRETLNCTTCSATMRDRQLATGLLSFVRDKTGSLYADLAALRKLPPTQIAILDTDSFSPLNKVLRGMQGYVHSQYRADLDPGATLPDGSVNVDLLDVPFPEGHFDAILTSDVMEHVGDDEGAHREIHRCLKPDGAYIFTVPYDPTLAATKRLTVSTGAPDEYIFLEHHVHGDPHSASGIIAHRIYGKDFFDNMERLGFAMRFETIESPEHGIFGGDLFVAVRKR